MDDKQKEYIVTKIEKYDDISIDSIIKLMINSICALVFILINRINISDLPDNLEVFINQVLSDVSLLGMTIAATSVLINCIKAVYFSLRGMALTKKIEDYDKDGLLINEESKEGKQR